MGLSKYYELATPNSFERLHFDDIKEKRVFIPDDFPIARDVKYGMNEWQLKDLLNERYVTVNDSKTRIDWSIYVLPPLIIDDLKRLALLCLFSSMCASPKSTRKKAMKPNTVTQRIHGLGKFLTRVYESSTLFKQGNKAVSSVKQLSDISYEMIRREAMRFPENGNSIIVGLNQLSKYEIRQFLNSDPEQYDWSIKDISNIKFEKVASNKKAKQSWQDKTLPNSLFRFITRNAVADISTAALALGMELNDKSAIGMANEKQLKKFKEIDLMISSYIEIRRLDIERSTKSLRKRYANGSSVTTQTGKERKKFKDTYGLTVKEFTHWWTMVRTSAQIIILQYIGFRHSESLSLKFDHALPKNKALLRKVGNVWVIRGTVIKHKDSNLPTDQNEWVAIPIVRDAIAVLEAFNIILNKSYVFSSSQNRGKSKDRGKSFERELSDTPYSPSGFSQAINRWKEKKDINNIWSHWNLNIKQFRHSIVNQLARAELGLEFITYQMKHMVHAMSEMPSDVTLGYGGVGETMQESALKTAKEEAVRSLFHPDNPVAGGMADEFDANRMAHFSGAMASGMTEDEYFSLLVEQGIPFINVGGGYCSGRKYVQYSDGSKANAPCIGSYECSPHKCSNAIITRSHIPIWIDMYNSNKSNSTDPQLFYAREAFTEKANEAKQVLELLDVKVEFS